MLHFTTIRLATSRFSKFAPNCQLTDATSTTEAFSVDQIEILGSSMGKAMGYAMYSWLRAYHAVKAKTKAYRTTLNMYTRLIKLHLQNFY